MQAETDDMNAEEYSRYKMQLHAQRSSLPSVLPREAEKAAASMSLAFSGKWDKIDEVLFQNKVVEFIKDVPKGESVKQKARYKVARRDRHAKIQGKREFPDKEGFRENAPRRSRIERYPYRGTGKDVNVTAKSANEEVGKRLVESREHGNIETGSQRLEDGAEELLRAMRERTSRPKKSHNPRGGHSKVMAILDYPDTSDLIHSIFSQNVKFYGEFIACSREQRERAKDPRQMMLCCSCQGLTGFCYCADAQMDKYWDKLTPPVPPGVRPQELLQRWARSLDLMTSEGSKAGATAAIAWVASKGEHFVSKMCHAHVRAALHDALESYVKYIAVNAHVIAEFEYDLGMPLTSANNSHANTTSRASHMKTGRSSVRELRATLLIALAGDFNTLTWAGASMLATALDRWLILMYTQTKPPDSADAELEQVNNLHEMEKRGIKSMIEAMRTFERAMNDVRSDLGKRFAIEHHRQPRIDQNGGVLVLPANLRLPFSPRLMLKAQQRAENERSIQYRAEKDGNVIFPRWCRDTDRVGLQSYRK